MAFHWMMAEPTSLELAWSNYFSQSNLKEFHLVIAIPSQGHDLKPHEAV